MYKTSLELLSQLYQQYDELKNVYRQQNTVSSDETGNTANNIFVMLIKQVLLQKAMS
jgi:CRISPR-associated protein Cas8b1/Cst1 subtype I-B